MRIEYLHDKSKFTNTFSNKYGGWLPLVIENGVLQDINGTIVNPTMYKWYSVKRQDKVELGDYGFTVGNSPVAILEHTFGEYLPTPVHLAEVRIAGDFSQYPTEFPDIAAAGKISFVSVPVALFTPQFEKYCEIYWNMDAHTYVEFYYDVADGRPEANDVIYRYIHHLWKQS